MKHRRTVGTVFLSLLLAAGVCLLAYPTLSNAWNARRQTRAIVAYTGQVAALDAEQAARLRGEAETHNRSLLEHGTNFFLTEAQQAEYDALLDPSGTGMMGYLEIPQIGVRLPVYHGADEAVLRKAVGHLAWSSLPVGGTGTHCVLSGHRGLPGAKLFTDLDQLAGGDTFTLCVLGRELTYEIDSIQTVLPGDTQALAIDPGEDLCTLVTCTPYGVNTHRLLVRGHRVENPVQADPARGTVDAQQTGQSAAVPVLALLLPPVLAALFLLWRRLKKRGRKDG